MSFNIYHGDDGILGHWLKTDRFLVFFGNKLADLETLQKEFSDYTFCSLKQVHGNTVVNARLEKAEADAHLGSQKNFALAIQTADCLPVMMFDPKTSTIAAIHAGWRGVENGVIINTLREIHASPDTMVFIGPHIMKNSFAVDKDVADLFPEKHVMYNPLQQKYFVDLDLVARDQMLSLGILEKNIHTIYTNTFSDESYCSYRRQKQKGLRQYSFIVLL